MNKRLCFFIYLTLLSVGFIPGAMAEEGGLKLPQTRVIFDAKTKNATASIQNRGKTVYLIKASVLTGLQPDAAKAPFAVMPPLFRLEAHNQQTVRIVRQGTIKLPVDRESVFYLSFLAIPAVASKEQSVARLSIGVQTVIKLFYRPAHLPLSPELAAEKVIFNKKNNVLIAQNQTPYYLTFNTLSVDKKSVTTPYIPMMIAPFSTLEYPYTGDGKIVAWTVINDFGGISKPYHAGITVTGAQ